MRVVYSLAYLHRREKPLERGTCRMPIRGMPLPQTMQEEVDAKVSRPRPPLNPT